MRYTALLLLLLGLALLILSWRRPKPTDDIRYLMVWDMALTSHQMMTVLKDQRKVSQYDADGNLVYERWWDWEAGRFQVRCYEAGEERPCEPQP